ncbi:tryptophan-rich sensory protein [Cribrihabitans neustonicus]|uniref:tryptophan-rich sensory protein n=1 Tax=Cribrihabitans neustonicus TaxID=1429085 RepID=UPI003B5AF897
MTRKILAYGVFFLALAFALAPYFTGGFAGYSAEQLPYPQPNPPMQPAGWAFSIWGLIYLWLLAGAGYGAWKAPRSGNWHRMRQPLALSLALGIFWLPAANSAPVAATVMILLMTAGAIAAVLRANIHNRIWKRGPVGLYAGWLTAASGVSLSIVLPGFGLMGAEAAAILCLALVLAVTVIVQTLRPVAWTYTAAVCWALFALLVGHAADGHSQPVKVLAALGLLLLTARAIIGVVRHARQAPA